MKNIKVAGRLCRLGSAELAEMAGAQMRRLFMLRAQGVEQEGKQAKTEMSETADVR